MAIKTLISDEEFRAVLSQYALGAYNGADPISAGTVQTNYVLLTEGGRYVFRCYENRTRESVGFECNLTRYLKQHGYPCPAPLKNKHGQMVGMLRGKPFVIFEFIDGQHLENPTPAQRKQLIHKAAELQNLTRGYRPRGWQSRRDLQSRWNYTPAQCHALAREAAQRIGTPNARAKLEWHTQALADLALPKTHPKGICHCDFHFSNILFKDGAFAALLDFDDANYTFLTFDLAVLINPFIPSFDWATWQRFRTGDAIIDLSESRSVAEEYQSVRPLSALEKRHLFDVFRLGILFDCIWYFERGDVADFYEKRKIDALNAFGRDRFYQHMFG